MSRRFTEDQLLQIAMPMGGLGAGSISLAGNGALVDWAIRNRPETSALPDNWRMTDAGYGIVHIKGEQPITKLIEGPIPRERIYDQGLMAQGFRKGNYEGLPRFDSATFDAAFPTGTVSLTHPKVPLAVSITGFNPFIPLDDRASGMPCAILEYAFNNTSNKPVSFEFSYHLSHLAMGHRRHKGSRNQRLDEFGVRFFNDDPANYSTFGSAAFGIVGRSAKIKTMWFRGPWYDFISALWREVSTGQFKANESPEKELDGVNGASLMVECTLAPGESITLPIVIAWHFPNAHYGAGGPNVPWIGDRTPVYDEPTEAPPKWQPWYSTQWKDAEAVLREMRENYDSLRARTFAFRDALHSSTLPPEVIDAVSSNLAILKSPTVLRTSKGNLWAWEGCFTQHGSCHGSCTHVWNYAQALPHLFPKLERTLREGELERSMDERGHVNFRAALPEGPTPHDFHAAADGQLGGILKVYREWQISDDRAWADRMYPLAKKSLDYCIATWDPNRIGAVVEPHHNTYDIEFWGPDGMTTSCYVGALAALSKLAADLGHADDAKTYGELAKKAGRYLDEHLFNGEYHQQKVEYRSLKDQSFVKKIDAPSPENAEEIELLRKEGPKYQYGSGCLSDGVIGLWFAKLYGVNVPVDPNKTRSSLAAIHKHNFKSDLFEHACTQRPGYANGHEAGLILCSWPRGGQPTIPFVYSDEVWTGIEYQVASHLILEGMVSEGLEIVRGVRSRYEGHVRNPFNEYECGSYYARALASYALLPAMSGFRYSAVTKHLDLSPAMSDRPLKCFFSTASGFGTIGLEKGELVIQMIEGTLEIQSVKVVDAGTPLEKSWSVTARAGKAVKLQLR